MNAILASTTTDIVQAWGITIAALIAIYAVWTESRASRRTMGADTYSKLEEKFYHTDLMRGLRRRAATELANANTFDAFDDLADFFDFVGILVRRGVLDEEMAWSSYYRRATAFWDEGQSKGVIGRARERQSMRWHDYEYLVRRLQKVHSRNGGGASGTISKEERDVLLAQERRLPVIENAALSLA